MKTRLNHIYGFTTRANGNMATVEARRRYLVERFGDVEVFACKQIHGNSVKTVQRNNLNNIEPECDGLVYSTLENVNKIILTMRSADCPIIAAWDSANDTIGLCHAGWKGIVRDMVPSFLNTFISAGGNMAHTFVYISPHIHACCYEFAEPEIQYFIAKYPTGVVRLVDGKYYIDLAEAICLDAVNHGILRHNLNISSDCTSCGVSKYYSYRRKNSSLYGEMMTFIGLL
jgi:YfiH family protein